MKEKVFDTAICGVSACVPGQLVTMEDLYRKCVNEEQEKTLRHNVQRGGYNRHYIARPETTAADLSFRAGKALMTEMNWAPDSIDALFMLTIHPDQFTPPVGFNMHQRLGLSRDCLVLDMTANCAVSMGHALWLASGLINRKTARRVLILAGSTMSKTIRPDDLENLLWTGEAGGAFAVEYRDGAGPISFMVDTDSSGLDCFKIHGLGFQTTEGAPFLEVNGLRTSVYYYSMLRSLLGEIAAFSGMSLSEMDRVYVHQTSLQHTTSLMRALKLDAKQVPIVLDSFGCCMTSDFPIMICDDLPSIRGQDLSVCFGGFGTGFSANATHMRLEDVTILPVIHAEDL